MGNLRQALEQSRWRIYATPRKDLSSVGLIPVPPFSFKETKWVTLGVTGTVNTTTIREIRLVQHSHLSSTQKQKREFPELVSEPLVTARRLFRDRRQIYLRAFPVICMP
jgi:hypothetical protein